MRLRLAVLTLLLAVLAPARAEDAGRTPTPTIPKAQGGPCVRDPAYMRRWHMTMLLHQRDVTVHQGDRSGEFALDKCVNCHAVKGDDGQPVAYSDPRHFCRSCHSYEAVTIDCFDCHASRPPAKDKSADLGRERDLAALSAYAEGITP